MELHGDERAFSYQATGGYSLNTFIPTTPLVAALLMGQATVPIAALLRWRVLGVVGTWTTTFRILVSGNAPGLDLTSAQLSPGPTDLSTVSLGR